MYYFLVARVAVMLLVTGIKNSSLPFQVAYCDTILGYETYQCPSGRKLEIKSDYSS